MRQRLQRSLLSAAILLLAGLSSGSAAGSDADGPAAAALIEQGLDLRQAGRDSDALALFEKAQALSPSPRGQAQVALAQQALGRWLVAERNLSAALAVKSDPWIESRRPILERAMTVISGHLGDVEIVGAKSGAVYIDGARVDEPDALTKLRLEIGRRTFELRAPGSYPISRVLDVLPGEIVRVEVEQHPLLEDGSAVAPEALAVPAAAPASPLVGARTQRTMAWVSLGGAGVLVVTAVAGLVDRSISVSDFNATAACTGTASNKLDSQCNGWISDGKTGQALSIAGFVGAGALGALSVVLLLTAPRKPKATAASLLAVEGCAPVRGGLSCSLKAAF